MNASAPKLTGGMCCLKISGASANAIIIVTVDGVEFVPAIRQSTADSLTICFPLSDGPHAVGIDVDSGGVLFHTSFFI